MNPFVENNATYRQVAGLPLPYPDARQEAALSDLIDRANHNAPSVNPPTKTPPPVPSSLSAAFEVIGAKLGDHLQANSDLLLELSNFENRIAARLAEQDRAKQSETERKKADLEGELRELVTKREALHHEVVAVDIRLQDIDLGPLAKAENALSAARAGEPKIDPGHYYPSAGEHHVWRLKVEQAEADLQKVRDDISSENAARQELLEDLADVSRLIDAKERERETLENELAGVWKHGGFEIKKQEKF